MSKTTLNAEGESAAHALIRAGHYDMASPWSFSAGDGDALLGPKGDDWDKYGRWHLGEDPSEDRETKAHWKYPYGKDGKVYRRALGAIRSRASTNGDDTVFEAAGRLMTAMDEEEKKKDGTMSLRQILASRFGHFAATPAPRADDDAGGDDDEAKKAKKAEEDDEARKRAEEEEKARKSRRARKARRTRGRSRPPEDDDDDDAGDDDEDEDDDDSMRKAAAAGHASGLDAAFRAGARAQRRRCSAILAHTAAAANPVLAMSVAFETAMTADAAIAVLQKTPSPSPRSLAPGLHDRMAASPAGAVRVPTSAPDGPRGAAATAASWDFALKDFAPSR